MHSAPPKRCTTTPSRDVCAPSPSTDVNRERWTRARRASDSPRLYAACQPWCREGDRSVHRLLSRQVPAVCDQSTSQRRGVARRAIWLAAWTFARPRRRPVTVTGGAVCRRNRAGGNPRAWQERPPRQCCFAAPALTPEGVAPARLARPPPADEMTRGLRFLFLFRRALARRNRTRIRLTRRREGQPSNRARLRSTSLATTACMGENNETLCLYAASGWVLGTTSATGC